MREPPNLIGFNHLIVFVGILSVIGVLVSPVAYGIMLVLYVIAVLAYTVKVPKDLKFTLAVFSSAYLVSSLINDEGYLLNLTVYLPLWVGLCLICTTQEPHDADTDRCTRPDPSD